MEPGPRHTRARAAFDWMFRDRTTGAVTVAQFPNAALWVWLAATLLGIWWQPQVAGRDALAVVSTLAILVWAADELLRGVNPFRRLLGAVVLVVVGVGLLR